MIQNKIMPEMKRGLKKDVVKNVAKNNLYLNLASLNPTIIIEINKTKPTTPLEIMVSRKRLCALSILKKSLSGNMSSKFSWPKPSIGFSDILSIPIFQITVLESQIEDLWKTEACEIISTNEINAIKINKILK